MLFPTHTTILWETFWLSPPWEKPTYAPVLLKGTAQHLHPSQLQHSVKYEAMPLLSPPQKLFPVTPDR